MVLEARQGAVHTGLELALEQDVADHARVAGDGVEGEDADPREVGPVEIAVRAAEELVAAAHREQRRARRHRLTHTARFREQVLCNERLFAVLPAADVEEVVLARFQRVADGDGSHLELVAAPGRAT